MQATAQERERQPVRAF